MIQEAVLCLKLPVPPTANDWANARRQPYSKAARATRARIDAYTWEVKAAVMALDPDGIPFTNPVCVYMELHHSNMDLDNPRKVLYDALTKAGVLADDRLIVEDGGKRHRSKRSEQHIVVTIREVSR